MALMTACLVLVMQTAPRLLRCPADMIGYAGADRSFNFPRRPHHRGASCVPASEGPCADDALCNACDSPW
eukprot:515173-Prymnesium_polylepis.1